MAEATNGTARLGDVNAVALVLDLFGQDHPSTFTEDAVGEDLRGPPRHRWNLMLSVREAANRLGISASKLYELVSRRAIFHYRIGGKALLDPADLPTPISLPGELRQAIAARDGPVVDGLRHNSGLPRFCSR